MSTLYWKHPSLEHDNIRHGFFGRHLGNWGASEGLYESLNCGIGTKDNPENIEKNRASAAQVLGFAPEQLMGLIQTHSNEVAYINKPHTVQTRPDKDALVTDIPGLALAILTADCAPVLFAGTKQDGLPIVGAAHAGWRGAVGGILQTTLHVMQSHGAKLDTVSAVIGPCIAQDSYEVGEEVYEAVVTQSADLKALFKPTDVEEKFLFDLAGYCQMILAAYPLKSIENLGIDTYAEEDDFFSYRRATHRGQGQYGRQISIIGLIS